MLTPIELQNKNFKSGGLGYDKRDVDQFFAEVNNSYMRLYSENIDLKDKIAVLNNALQQYKAMEKTLQKALVLAEKTAEDTKEAAIRNARHIEKEAVTKAQIIMADARNELDHLHTQTLDMLKQFEKYKAQFKSLAAAQLELLESDSYSLNAARLETFVDSSRTSLEHDSLQSISAAISDAYNALQEADSAKEEAYQAGIADNADDSLEEKENKEEAMREDLEEEGGQESDDLEFYSL